MNISGQRDRVLEAVEFSKTSHAALRQLAVTCILTRTDRRALANHIQRSDRIATGVHVMLARLLSKKLLYASVVDDAAVWPSIAVGGSRLTYTIDELGARTGYLFHDDAYGLGQNGLHVATLLGATLIGMKAGTQAPFLQADGSFRKVRMISVDNPPLPSAQLSAA